MFPLGTVLVPGLAMPLHVFEPRYRALVRDVLAGDRRIGVVLIERGHEVGGGDQRSMAGTLADVGRADELDDGRWVLVVTGRRRIRVDQWLPDDPYPRARVTSWPEQEEEVPGSLLAAVEQRLAAVVDLSRRLGNEVPDVALSTDPSTASWQATVLAGLGPLDAQQLLEQPGPRSRLEALLDLLDGRAEVLSFRLHDGA